MTDPIIKTMTLGCAAAHAFDVFVNRIARWWPLDGHTASQGILGKPALAVTIEPFVGGRVYESMPDGNENLWGTVESFTEGAELSFTWHPGNNADNPTKVSVTFEAAGEGCVVTLTHTGWEVWGDTAEGRRGGYDSGWDFVLGQHYVPACG